MCKRFVLVQHESRKRVYDTCGFSSLTASGGARVESENKTTGTYEYKNPTEGPPASGRHEKRKQTWPGVVLLSVFGKQRADVLVTWTDNHLQTGHRQRHRPYIEHLTSHQDSGQTQYIINESLSQKY